MDAVDPLEAGAQALEGVSEADDLAVRLGLAISARDVAEAARRIAPYVKRTPVTTSSTLDEQVFGRTDDGHAGTVYFKCENFQKVGAFKFRGACNAVFAQNQDDLPAAGVITHSSGNHGQALALAGKLRQIPVTIVVPKGAPKAKVDAMRGYGAQIVEVDPSTRDAATEERVAATGALFVHPSNEPLVMAGQGTLLAEFWAQVCALQRASSGADAAQMKNELAPVFDAVVVPVGGGGMLSGVAVVARALLGPKIRIIAAEPELADDAARSKAANALQGHRDGKVPQTIADGLRTTLGSNTWPVVRDVVDEVIVVSESQIVDAMHFAFERMKLVIEPSAAVGLAAVLSDAFKRDTLQQLPKAPRVGVVFSGGNVSLREALPFQTQITSAKA
ncbi:Serine racemase [Hondaea fermentalgiana]|uniref:Serine racemase n=1 Tax=Hondaea fermentalgiana TaxID=2315210 RepID=A0A2R5GI18_9STRA|nr:Serine racemase [Hondaea fermentalgiana]|eukprot:GBG30532.1 Serine racemase [Hondaea fermentalgiana]